MTTRKIAFIGSAPTLDCAPWHDPSWEIWAHATCWNLCPRADRYFDLHPWEWIVGKKVPGYLEFLKTTKTPVYLQHANPEVPMSWTYPKDRILSEFRPYFTNHMAYMSALALTEGVTHVGLWGVHYEHDVEHVKQRPCCEYWVGMLEGRGVTVLIPPKSPVTREPNHLYGYESHEGRFHKRAKSTEEFPVSPTMVKTATPLIAGPAEAPRLDVDQSAEVTGEHAKMGINLEQLRAAFETGGVPVIHGKPAW